MQEAISLVAERCILTAETILRLHRKSRVAVALLASTHVCSQMRKTAPFVQLAWIQTLAYKELVG